MRKRYRQIWNIFSLAVLGLSCFAIIDAWAADPQVFNLDQLITMALEKSPELKEADQDVVVAESDLAQAKAGRWAQLDVTGTAGPAENAKRPLVTGVTFNNNTFVGHIVDQDESGVGIFGRLDFYIVQPLYTFGKISHRKNAAEFGLAAQRAQREKSRGEVILNTKKLYYGLIIAGQGKSAAEDADAFYSDAKRRIERLIEAGSKNVDENDLYRIESLSAEVKKFSAKADSGARLSYLALKQAIGFPPTHNFKLDARELPKETARLASQEEYIQRALAQRPEFEQLRNGVEAKRELFEASKADLYPSIFAMALGSLAGAPDREKLDVSYFTDEFNHAYAGVVLGSRWHFDFGIGKGKIAKSSAEYQKILFSKEYAESNIPLEVAKYYQDAVEQEAAFRAYESAATAARKWVVASFSNFDLGVGTAKDMFDAIERYGRNQGEYLSALYNYHIALANLSYAVGDYKSNTP